MPAPQRRPVRVTLYQRAEDPEGAWWYDFRVSGVRHRRSTGSSVREVAEDIALRARELAQAEAAQRAKLDPGAGTVDLARLGGLDLTRAISRGVTASQQRSIMGCWKSLTRVLGAERRPDTIDYDLCQSYIAERRRAGVRGQSIRKELQALKRGMMIARRKRLITVALDEWPEVRNDPKDTKKAGKLHPQHILERWLEALDRVPKSGLARVQAEIALRTGIRAEEVRRLSWSWVEETPPGSELPAILRLPAWATKDRDERVVGLTQEALELIAFARTEQQLVTWEHFDTPLLAGEHKHAFQAACKLIDYPRAITLRDLRHCHASWSAQATGDIAAVQAALGHADLETTQRYLSSTVDRALKAALAVGAALKGRGGKSGGGVPGAPGGGGPPGPGPGAGHSTRTQSRSDRAKVGVVMVGVTGFEPATRCSQSDFEALLQHITTCSDCLLAFLQGISKQLDDTRIGHAAGHMRLVAAIQALGHTGQA